MNDKQAVGIDVSKAVLDVAVLPSGEVLQFANDAAGIEIDWRRHALTGVPVTLASLAVAGAGFWLRA